VLGVWTSGLTLVGRLAVLMLGALWLDLITGPYANVRLAAAMRVAWRSGTPGADAAARRRRAAGDDRGGRQAEGSRRAPPCSSSS
jgi:hypothetical protein